MDNSNQAGPSNTGTKRFVVQSSDVIQDMRVNVSEENSQKVIWYKERFLGDDEIIENVVHNPTTTICWTIHRPKRGWYIRIRAPSFPPGVFIPLTPLPLTSPYHVDASLSFKSRTSLSPPSIILTHHNDDSTASIHSYPPTPPAVIVRPPSPGPSRGGKSATTQISTFILSPSTTPPTATQTTASFFSRALSVLRSHTPAHSNSFTLSRVPVPRHDQPSTSSGSGSGSGSGTPPPPYASTVPLAIAASASTVPLVQPPPPTDSALTKLPHIQTQAPQPPPPPLHPPLLTFHDQTPVLTVRSLTGLFEIDRAEERALGVDTSFWVAVGLTYLEFLEERESYLAALSD